MEIGLSPPDNKLRGQHQLLDMPIGPITHRTSPIAYNKGTESNNENIKNIA